MRKIFRYLLEVNTASGFKKKTQFITKGQALDFYNHGMYKSGKIYRLNWVNRKYELVMKLKKNY